MDMECHVVAVEHRCLYVWCVKLLHTVAASTPLNDHRLIGVSGPWYGLCEDAVHCHVLYVSLGGMA